MRKNSLLQRMLLCAGFILLVLCTFAKASACPLDTLEPEDLVHSSGANVPPPANAIPKPLGVASLAFVAIVFGHRSTRRWS